MIRDYGRQYEVLDVRPLGQESCRQVATVAFRISLEKEIKVGVFVSAYMTVFSSGMLHVHCQFQAKQCGRKVVFDLSTPSSA